MILNTGLSLTAVLGGAPSTSQPEVHVDFVEWTGANEQTAPDTFRTALSDTTPVTILAAPVSNPKREPIRMVIHNKDTASVTVTVYTTDGTTIRVEVKRTLTTLQSLIWEKNVGYIVLATA